MSPRSWALLILIVILVEMWAMFLIREHVARILDSEPVSHLEQDKVLPAEPHTRIVRPWCASMIPRELWCDESWTRVEPIP